MPPVPTDEPLGYRRGRRVSYNEAVGTAPIPHGHAIVNSPPPNPSTQRKDQSVRYGGPYSSTPWDRPRRVIAKVEHHLGELFPRVGFIVTTLGTNRAVVRFYNQRRTAEQWIKEGKTATHWTRLSCHRFRANEVRLLLGVIADNLGNLLRRLVLPVAIQNWSLTSLQQRLFKTGGRLTRRGRELILLLARRHLAPALFRVIPRVHEGVRMD